MQSSLGFIIKLETVKYNKVCNFSKFLTAIMFSERNPTKQVQGKSDAVSIIATLKSFINDIDN